MKKYFVTIIGLTFLLSCTKDVMYPRYEEEFTPPIEATSVDQWLSNQWCSYPSNEDSTAMLGLDLDNDQSDDIVFNISHSTNGTAPTSPSSPGPNDDCSNYYYITLSALNDWEIGVDDLSNTSFKVIHPFLAGDSINGHLNWKSHTSNVPIYIRLSGPGIPHNINVTGQYIGVHKGDQYGWIKFGSSNHKINVDAIKVGASYEEIFAGN